MFALSRELASAVYRNPIYHQLVFAALVISCAIRIAYLLNWSPVRTRIPDSKKQVIAQMFTTGAVTFASGFLVWNLDIIFCGTLTNWKRNLGWPAAFLLEGHSWWHLLTVSFHRDMSSTSFHHACNRVWGPITCLSEYNVSIVRFLSC